MKKITLIILTIFLLFDTASSKNKVKSLYEKGLEMTKQLDMLAESEDYVKLFTHNPELIAIVKEIGSIDYSSPKAVYEISGIDTAYMRLLLALTDINISQEIKDILKNKYGDGVASAINAQNGAMFMSATMFITYSESFIYSGINIQKTYLFLYGNEYASIITFTPFQKNIVTSSASIVMNEDFSDIKTKKDVSAFFRDTLGFTGLKISLVTE